MTEGKEHIVVVSRGCKCVTQRLMFNGPGQVQIHTVSLDDVASWICEA